MDDIKNPRSSKKIHQRIRKLLAMGSDKSSLNEAGIAIRRARTLMDKHQISLSDIKNMTNDDLGLGKYDLGSNKQKTWISTLLLNIAKLNDCVVGFSTPLSDKEHITYVFKGFQEDVTLCEFMTVYLVDTCQRLYERDKNRLNLNSGTDKEDFLLGMADKINSRIQVLIAQRAAQPSILSDGRSLVVSKSALVAHAYGEQRVNNTKLRRRANYKAWRGGRIASQGVHLGKFMHNKYQPNQMLTH